MRSSISSSAQDDENWAGRQCIRTWAASHCWQVHGRVAWNCTRSPGKHRGPASWVPWCVSAGNKISQDDRESLKGSVEAYVVGCLAVASPPDLMAHRLASQLSVYHSALYCTIQYVLRGTYPAEWVVGLGCLSSWSRNVTAITRGGVRRHSGAGANKQQKNSAGKTHQTHQRHPIPRQPGVSVQYAPWLASFVLSHHR